MAVVSQPGFVWTKEVEADEDTPRRWAVAMDGPYVYFLTWVFGAYLHIAIVASTLLGLMGVMFLRLKWQESRSAQAAPVEVKGPDTPVAAAAQPVRWADQKSPPQAATPSNSGDDQTPRGES